MSMCCIQVMYSNLMQDQLEILRTYQRTQKPPKAVEKAHLETHYNTLQTKLRISSRPAYTPTDGKTVSDIAEAWRHLDIAEKEYEDFVFSEMKRFVASFD